MGAGHQRDRAMRRSSQFSSSTPTLWKGDRKRLICNGSFLRGEGSMNVPKLQRVGVLELGALGWVSTPMCWEGAHLNSRGAEDPVLRTLQDVTHVTVHSCPL